MTDQLQLFNQYKRKLNNSVGLRRAGEIIANSFYMVVAGSNDFAETYYHTPLRTLKYDLHSYTDFLITSASAFLRVGNRSIIFLATRLINSRLLISILPCRDQSVQLVLIGSVASNLVKGLYKLGARRIAILGLTPLGCLPSQRTLSGGPRRVCVELFNDAAKVFNSKLQSELQILQTALPQVRFTYADGYGALMDIIQAPHEYGRQAALRIWPSHPTRREAVWNLSLSVWFNCLFRFQDSI